MASEGVELARAVGAYSGAYFRATPSASVLHPFTGQEAFAPPPPSLQHHYYAQATYQELQ